LNSGPLAAPFAIAADDCSNTVVAYGESFSLSNKFCSLQSPMHYLSCEKSGLARLDVPDLERLRQPIEMLELLPHRAVEPAARERLIELQAVLRGVVIRGAVAIELLGREITVEARQIEQPLMQRRRQPPALAREQHRGCDEFVD